MASMMLQSTSLRAPLSAPFTSRQPVSRVTPSRLIIRASNIGAGGKQASQEERKGVLPGLNQWPPKGITESSQPKPEDDPANFDAQGNRIGGPSEEEIAAKKEEQKKDRPFSNPNREGGTQVGGGGEGSGA